jgi:DNA-directed RNA polymerase subunit H (RpoH/RPB5)
MEKRAKELLELRKKEMERERGRGVIFLDSIKDAPFVDVDDTNTDIVVICDYKKQQIPYRRVGEVEIIPLMNILINPFEVGEGIKYEVLENAELGIAGFELPTLLYSDPIRIWRGWKAETIVKITRKDGRIYYRIVKE